MRKAVSSLSFAFEGLSVSSSPGHADRVRTVSRLWTPILTLSLLDRRLGTKPFGREMANPPHFVGRCHF